MPFHALGHRGLEKHVTHIVNTIERIQMTQTIGRGPDKQIVAIENWQNAIAQLRNTPLRQICLNLKRTQAECEAHNVNITLTLPPEWQAALDAVSDGRKP